MADEPSGAELSPDEAYRSIGRYVYEFSQLIQHMRAIMTRYLNTTPQAVAELAFAEAPAEQINNAFFGMCRAVTPLDASEEKTAARLRGRVGEAIEMRNNIAHSDWWVGSSVLGAQAVQLSARDLDARSSGLIDLTNLIAEYGSVCLRGAPYDTGDHRVGDYLVMRAGEVVREGPKAIASPRVFYRPSAITGSEAPATLDRAAALRVAPVSAPAALPPEPEAAPPEPDGPPAPEPLPPLVSTPQPAPEPATPPEPVAPPTPIPTPTPTPPSSGLRLRAAALLRTVWEHRRMFEDEGVPIVADLPAARAASPAGHRRLRNAVLALCALTAGLLSYGAYHGHIFNSIEQNTIDTRFAIRGPLATPKNIVIVAVDTPSVTGGEGKLPLWPFPRRYEANVISFLHAAGAKAIGVDIEFTSQTDPTDDNDLVAAVEHAPGTVLVTTAVTGSGGTDIFGMNTSQLLSQFGAHASNAYLAPNNAAVVPTVAYSNNHLPTFAVALAAQVTGHPVPQAEFPRGSALVDFLGPPGTFKMYSFANVCTLSTCVTPHIPAQDFRGKIVLIGATAPVLQDQHATPVGATMSGVEYWANALESILRGSPLRYGSSTINLLVVLLFAVIAPLSALWLRPGLLMLALAIGLGAIYLAIAQLEFNAGKVISVVYPILALTLGTIEATAGDLWAERRHRRHLEIYKAAYEALPSAASAGFFISYRRDQSSWPARILRDELVRRFGEDQVFMDNDSIEAGQEWPDRLERAIGGASVVLVLIGPSWADARSGDGQRRLENPGDWVRLEVEAALANKEIAVVPVLLDNATMPGAEALPESLRPLSERHALSLTPARWNDDVEALIESIQTGRIKDFMTKQARARNGG